MADRILHPYVVRRLWETIGTNGRSIGCVRVFSPGYLLAVLSYNLTIRRKKLSAWRYKFLCMRCGNTITHHH